MRAVSPASRTSQTGRPVNGRLPLAIRASVPSGPDSPPLAPSPSSPPPPAGPVPGSGSGVPPPAGQEPTDAAALAYGLTLSVTAIFFNAVWHYAALGRRLLREDASPREIRGISRSYIPGPFMYAGAGLVGLASPDLAVALFAAIALVYVSASIWARDESPIA